MKNKTITDFIFEDGKFIAHLDTNYNIAAIRLLLDSEEPRKLVDTTIEYAQNHITSDLLFFASSSGKTGALIKFVPNAPVPVSDIFLTISEPGITVKKMEVFLSEDLDLEKCYPLYKDTNLEENYYLDTITVFTSPEGYSQYTVYTSLDGRDFDEVARKTSKETCPESGETYHLNGKEARIIRVYIEYNSESVEAALIKTEFSGQKSGTPLRHTPEICIPDFSTSKYNVEITEADTYEEIYGIIDRQLGKKYRSWFQFKLTEEKKYDYFEIKDNDGKIAVTGNNGVSLATGLNHYLKYFCNVNISQVGKRTVMPKNVVPVKKTIHKETKAKQRYAYNYCTHSYSMAFWGEKEWRDELDWLALNGVTLVLDITAQEEVWRRFLSEIGYSHTDIKKFIAGPAYYAWAYMANLTGFGGPVHDSWFEERCELARKNHLAMRKLGMQPVLQGYSGMVPADIQDYDKSAEIITQGTWCSFRRPDMLVTTSDSFRKYAHMFYKAQKEVFGNAANYFATDPFHEGGITGDMQPREISREILSAMLRENPDSVWVIQSWQGNPTSELLCGLDDINNGKDHALILDLYAEKQPNYPRGSRNSQFWGYDTEFDHTPWIYCMLNNFGGRLGLHGHLDNLAREIPKVLNTCTSFAGIGITPEASGNNPLLYDFLFESVWCDDASAEMPETDLEEWTEKYILRRYGAISENTLKAWRILRNTVYKADLNMLGQGSPECIANARPELSINAASTWGNAVVSYDKELLKTAKQLFIKDYDLLCESDGYRYDLVTLIQQDLSNDAQELHSAMAAAFQNRDISGFEEYSNEFLKLIDKMDVITGTNEHYLLGKWAEQAKALAQNADDFSRRLYELNARLLITTWGSYTQSELGGLHDYSNRQWSGLINDFYKARWKKWISVRLSELRGESFTEPEWFEFEWNWARSNNLYTTTPTPIDMTEF